jgi:hypothetical protein
MTPTSKLEAVNILLSSVGEAPVNSLSSGLVDAEMAETILGSTSRAVQSRGWHWNREVDVDLLQDASGHVPLPANTLLADPSNSETELDLIQRGMKFYNRKTHSFVVGTSLKANLTILLEFTDLPEAARRYITVRGARIFQDRILGSRELHGFQEIDEAVALADLQGAEAEAGDYSIFNNYDVYRVIDRVGGTYGSN